MQELKTEFIEFVLEANVLRFGNFMTKNCRKIPYLVQSGDYKTGKQFARLGQFYARYIIEVTGGKFDAVFGSAYKGIALVTAVTYALSESYGADKPFFFNRRESVPGKFEMGVIAGYHPQDGDSIIAVDDSVAEGHTIQGILTGLRSIAEVQVNDLFVAVDHCEVSKDGVHSAVQSVQEEFGTHIHSIITVRDIYDYICEHGIQQEYVPALKQYMDENCII